MNNNNVADAYSGSTRWWILAFLSVMLFGNYYVYDAVAPLADTLETALGFTDTQIGALNAIYSLPNVFMVLIGGLLIDRYGPGRVALWTTAICLFGALLTAARGEFFTMLGPSGSRPGPSGSPTLGRPNSPPTSDWASGRGSPFSWLARATPACSAASLRASRWSSSMVTT